MPKRSRAEAPQVVKNVTINKNTINTINNYFAPAPAPAPSEGPKSLFATNADRIKRTSVVKNGKPCSVLVWQSAADGTIKAGCHNMCTKQWVDLSHFAPMDGSSRTQGFRTKFDAAYAKYKEAHAAGDRDECVAQRGVLESLRADRCFECRKDKGYVSPAQSACKAWYDATRKEMAARHGGCQNQDCPERGEHVWCTLTADHGTNPKKRDKHNKLVDLGRYTAWPALGGVPAMEEEAKQIEQWICKCCHRVEPTSSSGRRCKDPEDMPEGKRNGTKEEAQQYEARRIAVRVYPKQKHVDAAKRCIGKCAACGRPVEEGKEVMHEFNHLDEATKSKGGLFGKHGGVSGMVQNCSNAATLDKVVGLLDAEISKCNLLCCNCHHRHTWKYDPSAMQF